MARICIVTISSLYATPRVVKEANALQSAGHEVRVVYAQAGEVFSRPYDARIEQRVGWRATRVSYRADALLGRLWWKSRGMRQKICRRLVAMGFSGNGMAERAVGRLHPELTRLAAQEPADLFIGHYPGGLAAAAQAARKFGAKLGYDLEDCYFIQHEPGSAERLAIETVERRYLPKIDHLSASTRLIGAAFADYYGRQSDVEIRNCFDPLPTAQTSHLPSVVPRCFWFSQVVSLRRGLDVVLAALARCSVPLTLDLRGSCGAEERDRIQGLLKKLQLDVRVQLLPPVAPDDLIELASTYDIGFAAEAEDDANRPLTATNKLFTYLAAGLAIAATRQPGHVEAMRGIGPAVCMYEPGDVDGLVRILDAWAVAPAQLQQARQSAQSAGHGNWGWPHESRKLVAAVERALSSASTSAGRV